MLKVKNNYRTKDVNWEKLKGGKSLQDRSESNPTSGNCQEPSTLQS